VFDDGLGVGGAGALPVASTEGAAASLAWGAAIPSQKSTKQPDFAPGCQQDCISSTTCKILRVGGVGEPLVLSAKSEDAS
jgi:hypothetical protein